MALDTGMSRQTKNQSLIYNEIGIIISNESLSHIKHNRPLLFYNVAYNGMRR